MTVPTNQQRIQIIIAPQINYFYGVIGNRIAEALRNLGHAVTVSTLQDAAMQANDWLLLINISEIIIGHGESEDALRRLRILRGQSKHSGVVLLDCVSTEWFGNNARLARDANIDLLIDMGLHDQRINLSKSIRQSYYFLLSGLTQSEREQVQRYHGSADTRPIPWTLIGHQEQKRAKLAKQLSMGPLEPNGFVYLPGLTAFSEHGPHLNGDQIRRVLEKTRYYIWCSHHDYFYMESERFRDALLAGAVPVKVMDVLPDPAAKLPFADLLIPEDTLAEQLSTFEFTAARDRFIEAYCALPSLEQSLSALLESQG